MDSYEGQAGGERAAGGAAGDAGEDISSEAKESGPGLLELSKPSEFRLRALKQQKYLTFNKGRARHGIRCSVGFWAESRRGRERDGSRSLPAIVRYEECWRAAAPALYWFRAAGTGVTGSDCECGLSFSPARAPLVFWCKFSVCLCFAFIAGYHRSGHSCLFSWPCSCCCRNPFRT